MTFDWLLALWVGFSIGLLVGLTVGVWQFKKGVETGIRMHMVRDFLAQQKEQQREQQ